MLQAVMTIPMTGHDTSAEDRRMAAACAAGDAKIFEELYRRFGDRMKSIAWNHLGNAADAEDAVQETFLKIHRAAATYSGEASFSTWAYRILVNSEGNSKWILFSTKKELQEKWNRTRSS